MPEISVIIPVYNVAPFIERCAESLMRQTFSDAEFIFVDDCSTDDSVERLRGVLAEYPERNARILSHGKNCGLPSSRKTGFEACAGRFVYNCDGDDWVEPDTLEKLHSAAVAEDADFVYCDFFLTFGTNERYMRSPAYRTTDELLRKGFLSGGCKYNWWNKLIRRDLFEGVEFPVEHFKGGEDMVVIEMLSRARAIACVSEALYHYVKTNASAISEGFSEKRLESIRYNAEHAMRELEKYPGDLGREIALFKLNVKLPFLLSDDRRKYAVWKRWYPEANRYIFCNPVLPFRTKALQGLAAINFWAAVRLYYIICFKFVYGILYR